MKTEIIKKFRDNSLDELKREIENTRKDIFKVKISSISSPNKNIHLVKNLRRKLACMLTILGEKEKLNG